MTLAEKIAALRGERKLSQGDLAERLDVSRQSVSKWETGQAVPELDKIIRLADLFGVSVDELVREEAVPQPVPAPAAEPGKRIVYVERQFTTAQTLGIILIAGGLAMILMAAFVGGDPLLFIGGALAVLGLPLLLAKKHPFLIVGWMLWAAGYFTLFNPAFVRYTTWNPLYGFVYLWYVVTDPETYFFSHSVMALLAIAYVGVTALTVALPVCTGRLAWNKWKRGKEPQKETEAE